MSIITRTIKFMGKQSCIPVKIANISLDEKRVTIYGEKYFYNEMQVWYGMTLIQNKGMLQDYSVVEQEDYHKKRNTICNMTMKLIELIRTVCGTFSSLTPMSEKELQELSVFYETRQNLDYPQEYVIRDWQEDGCFGTDLYVRAECLEPLENIQKYEVFSEDKVITLGMQMAKALMIYNQVGVSFLAMAPARIGRSKDGIYKVTPENWRWTYDKYALANRCYMSPEELKQDKRDNRSDIYRLGLILYELCNHNRRLNCLHWYPSEQEAIERIAMETTLSKIDGISDSLFQVLQKACANEPEKRYQTAQELYDALRMCLASEKEKEAEKYVNEGKKYYYSNEGKPDYEKALLFYQKAAKLGSVDAYNRIGVMHYNGFGVKQNREVAVQYYQKAAEKGHMYAQNNLGWAYQNGIGIEANGEQAFYWYKKAAEQGYMNAQNNVGWAYEKSIGIEANQKQAFYWYKKAAEQGYMYAQYNVGRSYQYGMGIEADQKQAFSWYKKAADQGHAASQNYVGHCYYMGNNVEKNYEEAFKWFVKSEKQGNVDARFNLGLSYFYGNGVEKDYKKAFDLWKTLAEQNNYLGAMKKIANLYYNGNGVEKNYKEAFKWYEKVAETKDGEAYNYLGVMYHAGNGVEQSYEKALEYFKKSAEMEDSYGMYNYGMMYHYAKGVKKDMKLAKYWYEKAAAKGNTYAKTALEKLEK